MKKKKKKKKKEKVKGRKKNKEMPVRHSVYIYKQQTGTRKTNIRKTNN